jgi:hypothetical protein
MAAHTAVVSQASADSQFQHSIQVQRQGQADVRDGVVRGISAALCSATPTPAKGLAKTLVLILKVRAGRAART